VRCFARRAVFDGLETLFVEQVASSTRSDFAAVRGFSDVFAPILVPATRYQLVQVSETHAPPANPEITLYGGFSLLQILLKDTLGCIPHLLYPYSDDVTRCRSK